MCFLIISLIFIHRVYKYHPSKQFVVVFKMQKWQIDDKTVVVVCGEEMK